MTSGPNQPKNWMSIEAISGKCVNIGNWILFFTFHLSLGQYQVQNTIVVFATHTKVDTEVNIYAGCCLIGITAQQQHIPKCKQTLELIRVWYDT